MKFEPEKPIFSKTRMQFSPSEKITHMAVSSNYLVIAMANNKLFRLDLKQTDKHDGKNILIPLKKHIHSE